MARRQTKVVPLQWAASNKLGASISMEFARFLKYLASNRTWIFPKPTAVTGAHIL